MNASAQGPLQRSPIVYEAKRDLVWGQGGSLSETMCVYEVGLVSLSFALWRMHYYNIYRVGIENKLYEI